MQTVAAEVKKLNSEKDLSWRFQGNRVQFEFNSDLDESVKQASWAIDYNKLDYCKEISSKLATKLKKT